MRTDLFESNFIKSRIYR